MFGLAWAAAGTDGEVEIKLLCQPLDPGWLPEKQRGQEKQRRIAKGSEQFLGIVLTPLLFGIDWTYEMVTLLSLLELGYIKGLIQDGMS